MNKVFFENNATKPVKIGCTFASNCLIYKIYKVTMAEIMEKPEVQEEVQAQVEAQSTKAPAEEAAPVERKPRELLYERIRTSRPDANYDEDEEEYARQAMDILDELSKKGGAYDEMTQKLIAQFNRDPEEAEAFLEYLDGKPWAAALRRHKGDEVFNMKEGDEGWEDYVKAGKEREAQHAKNREALETYMRNANDSDVAMKEFLAESGLDEEGSKSFTELVTSIINDMSAGKVSKDTLSLLKRAVDYDKDMDGAREQGRVEGRNEKIEAEKKRMKGSGLPNANAGGSASEEVENTPANDTANWLGKFK